MKKALMLILVLAGLSAALGATIITNPSSGTVAVGQSIGARVDCLEGAACLMLWGDGTATNGSGNDFYIAFKYHVYRDPGTYTMHFRRYPFSTPVCPYDEYKTVTVLENRLITVSPSPPAIGLPLTFTASNFNTPGNIAWDMGDGTTYIRRTNVITHTYSQVGNYTVRAFDWNGDTGSTPVTLVLNLTRNLSYSPPAPRVDEPVEIRANGFNSDLIDWNFGDGSPLQTYSTAVSHRYQTPGVFTVTAAEHGNFNLAPVSLTLAILPENRSLSVQPAEARVNEPVTITAVNFRSRQVLWDFGDGSSGAGSSGPTIVTHAYSLPGNYTVRARDENGASQKTFQALVRILGISDQVDLDVAEITLDNGKYYKVVPKNSRNIRARLRMKMRGTGIVSGYWIVDGQPYEFFNETVYQGEIRTITTREIPGLPVFNAGMHTVSMQLTRPAGNVVFPTLRYYVLPFENEIVVLTPNDGAVVKEDEVPEFAWESLSGGSYYQIAFANSPLPLLHNDGNLVWLDCPDRLRFTPDALTWKGLARNQWVFWKVRATDSASSAVGESGIRELKIIVPGAQIGIRRISDMDGRDIPMGGTFTASRNDRLLVHGEIVYPGDAEFLVLRIYANDSLIDQLLFRDVKKGEPRSFETSVPNAPKESRVIFEVLKSSSPSLVIGYAELALKRE